MGRASWLFGVRVREYLHSYTLKSNSGYGRLGDASHTALRQLTLHRLPRRAYARRVGACSRALTGATAGGPSTPAYAGEPGGRDGPVREPLAGGTHLHVDCDHRCGGVRSEAQAEHPPHAAMVPWVRIRPSGVEAHSSQPASKGAGWAVGAHRWLQPQSTLV